MKTWAKALIILAVIASGTISLLLAPLVPVSYAGTEAVAYDGSVDQINLVANVEAANIRIEYAISDTADLINVAWDLTVRHSILIPPPTISVSLKNYTIGSVLNAELTINFSGLLLAAGLISNAIITINPKLASNFSITTTTGNINLSTTNFQKLEFLDVNLTSATGNIDTTFINGSDIQEDLRVQTTTGNCRVFVDTNSDIDGTLSVITTTGNNNVTLRENITLSNDFIIQANTGLVFFTIENCNLSGLEITGIIETSTGNIRATIDQRVDPNGNLTLDIDSDTGNIRLIIDLDIAGSIQSSLTPTTTTGVVTATDIVSAGYTYSSGSYNSQYGSKPYKIDATLDTDTSNIVLEGGYS